MSISIILSKTDFHSGERMKGIVKAEFKEETLVNGAVIEFGGSEHVDFSKAISLKRSPIFNLFKVLVGNQDIKKNPDGTPNLGYDGYQEPISLKGVYEWKFHFRIPNRVPSTVNIKQGEIKYKLTAHVIRVFGSEIHCTRDVRISGKLSKAEITETPSRYESEGSYYLRHQIDPTVTSDIQISGQVDKSLTYIGDEVKISLDLNISKTMKKRIKVIKAKLRQHVTFDVVGYSNLYNGSSTLSKSKHKDTQKILVKGKHKIEITMPLTHPCLQPFVNSKYIKISHHILIIIPTQMKDEIHLKIPITIELLKRDDKKVSSSTLSESFGSIKELKNVSSYNDEEDIQSSKATFGSSNSLANSHSQGSFISKEYSSPSSSSIRESDHESETSKNEKEVEDTNPFRNSSSRNNSLFDMIMAN